jgi:hypothetical protein
VLGWDRCASRDDNKIRATSRIAVQGCDLLDTYDCPGRLEAAPTRLMPDA